MTEIDGSFGEDGGQILRTALSLSTITKKPCHIFNIGKSRPKPGLTAQYLAEAEVLSKACKGKIEGAFLGSEEIKFYPGEIQSEDLHLKIEMAGSITLVLQTLILPSIFAPLPLKINFNGGATDTFFSPTIDYFRYVFLRILEKMGIKTEIDIVKHGYYPEGGANVKVKIFPAKLKNFDLTKRGALKKILAISGASDSLKEKRVAERQMAGAKKILGKLRLPLEEKVEYYQTDSPGSQICLAAEFENTIVGADNLGKIGKRAEDVGSEVALELLKEERSQACLDKHLADQILPFISLSTKKSQITVSAITEHCKSNIWVIEKFLEGKFKIENNLIQWFPEEKR